MYYAPNSVSMVTFRTPKRSIWKNKTNVLQKLLPGKEIAQKIALIVRFTAKLYLKFRFWIEFFLRLCIDHLIYSQLYQKLVSR